MLYAVATLTRRVEEVWGDVVVNHHWRFLHQRMLVVLAATTLTLAGCTSGGDDKPSPAPSTSSTSLSSSSASAPGTSSPSASVSVDLPEAARANTPEGGIEFAKFAVLQADRALYSNDARVFTPLTLSDCNACRGIEATIQAQKDKDSKPAAERLTIQGAQLYSPPRPNVLEIDLLGTEAAVDLINSAGAKVGHKDEAPLKLHIGLVWQGGSWRLGEMKPANT